MEFIYTKGGSMIEQILIGLFILWVAWKLVDAVDFNDRLNKEVK